MLKYDNNQSLKFLHDMMVALYLTSERLLQDIIGFYPKEKILSSIIIKSKTLINCDLSQLNKLDLYFFQLLCYVNIDLDNIFLLSAVQISFLIQACCLCNNVIRFAIHMKCAFVISQFV